MALLGAGKQHAKGAGPGGKASELPAAAGAMQQQQHVRSMQMPASPLSSGGGAGSFASSTRLEDSHTSLVQTLSNKCDRIAVLAAKIVSLDEALHVSSSSCVVAKSRCDELSSELRREKEKSERMCHAASKAGEASKEAVARATVAELAADKLRVEADDARDRARGALGEAAAAEAQLEAERERTRFVKERCDELKGALKRLARETADAGRQQDGTPEKRGDKNCLAASPTNKHQNERQLNQLLNENAYLKRQVASEIQCKKELQKALEKQAERLKVVREEAAQQQARLLQAQAPLPTQTNSTRASIDAEVFLSSLKGENESLTSELGEMRQCYQAARDNLTCTQKALESARELREQSLTSEALALSRVAELDDEGKREAQKFADLKHLLTKSVDDAELQVKTVAAQSQAATKRLAATLLCSKMRNLHQQASLPTTSLSSAFHKWATKSFRFSSAAAVAETTDRLKAEFDVALKSAITATREEALLTSRTEQESVLSTARETAEKNAVAEIQAARRHAAACVKKAQDDAKLQLSSFQLQQQSAAKQLEEAGQKLLTAKSDRDLMKSRILELQKELKTAKEENTALHTQQSASVHEQEDLRRAVQNLEAKLHEIEAKGKVENERALLQLERKLREEHAAEMRNEDSKNRQAIKDADENVRSAVSKCEARYEQKMEQEVESFREQTLSLQKNKEAAEREHKANLTLEVTRAKEETLASSASDFKQKLKAAVANALEDSAAKHAETLASMSKDLEEARQKLQECKLRGDEATETARADVATNLRKAVGEERARACRALQGARDEMSEMSRKAVDEAALNAQKEFERIQAMHSQQQQQLRTDYEDKIRSITDEMRAAEERFASERKQALVAEAKKWELAMDAQENARIEEIRSLSESSRSSAESSRKQIADAAKKAIEEARRRYQALHDEHSKLKQQAKETTSAHKDVEEAFELQVSDCKAAIAKLSKDLEASRDEVSRAEKEAATLNVNLLAVNEQAQALKEDGKRKDAAAERMKSELAALRAIQTKVSDLEKALERERVDRESEKDAMTKQASVWKERGSSWTVEKKALELAINSKEDALKALKSEMAAALEECKRVHGVEKRDMEGHFMSLIESKSADLEKAKTLRAEERLLADEKARAVAHERKEEMTSALDMLHKEDVRWKNKVDALGGQILVNERNHEGAMSKLKGGLEKEKDIQRTQLASQIAQLENRMADVKSQLAALVAASTITESGGGSALHALYVELRSLDLKHSRQQDEVRKAADKAREVEALARESEEKVKEHNNADSGSALSPGGGLSLAHVKKGRRLNEDLENGLRMVELARRSAKTLQKEIVELTEVRRNTEAKARELETKRCEECLSKIADILSKN